MREIQRLERLVLDAIVDYIRARRRVWVWTHAGIVLAVLTLESGGRIEARRQRGQGGHARWIYRTITISTEEGRHCQACTDPITKERRRAGGAGA
jgi:hypothetical protein